MVYSDERNKQLTFNFKLRYVAVVSWLYFVYQNSLLPVDQTELDNNYFHFMDLHFDTLMQVTTIVFDICF